MEPPILEQLTNDFGDRGGRAAQLLKTAETLSTLPVSAPRIGEAIAYCIREALIEIPRVTRMEGGQWRSVSREVVDARTRYETARGLTGMEEQKALDDLLRSIDDLENVHRRDTIHAEGLREVIRLRTGVDPLRHDANAFLEYQNLIKEANDMVHPADACIPVTAEAACACLQRAIDVLSRLFLVNPRIDQLKRLAVLRTPGSEDV